MKDGYSIKKDVNVLCDSLNLSEREFSEEAGLSLRGLQQAYKGDYTKETLEKVYGTIYKLGLRLNRAKAELFKESRKEGELLLFHGSKSGIERLRLTGSRDNCDFGNGFYCSELYSSAICFIETYDFSSVYLYSVDLSDLSCVHIPASLDWMILVCYFRRMLDQYDGHEVLKACLEKIKEKDVIIAPIADNRMFQIMREFGEGNITDLQAIHALSATRLGNQYVFKSEKALSRLKLLERLYASKPERENSIRETLDRKNVIDTKLRLAKREFRDKGKYIDEVFR